MKQNSEINDVLKTIKSFNMVLLDIDKLQNIQNTNIETLAFGIHSKNFREFDSKVSISSN
jgi:hypothetical protein